MLNIMSNDISRNKANSTARDGAQREQVPSQGHTRRQKPDALVSQPGQGAVGHMHKGMQAQQTYCVYVLGWHLWSLSLPVPRLVGVLATFIVL